MEANDSLEIMCWYKETADKQNKIVVNIVGGEDVTYGLCKIE